MRRWWWIPLVSGVAVAALLFALRSGDGTWRSSPSSALPEFPEARETDPPRTGRPPRARRRRFEGVPEEPRAEDARPVPRYHRSCASEPPRDGTPSQLARARDWVESLRAAARLPGDTPEELFAPWKAAFAEARDPLARQNLIFQAALVFPYDDVRPWLGELWHGEDPGDAEDALLALAFSGDPAARAEFATLARAPESRELIHAVCVPDAPSAINALPDDAARRVWRSYRAIEVLDREPYYKGISFLAWYEWRGHPATTLGDWKLLESELLRHWVRRYPGHPGSDDMALRIARNETDPMEAARWYGRAATWPDQDVTDGGLFGLVTMAELHLTPEQIDQLAHEEGLDTRNRMLLLYVRLRRIAADRGFEEAVRETAARAMAEPFCPIARAWQRRWMVPPPRGIESGIAPLPAGDPLRFVAPAAAGPEVERRPVRLSWYWYPPRAEGQPEEEAMRDPPAERLVLDTEALARQLRAWETLAELERRARRAGRAERSDLLYKQAAVFYHEPDTLFPVWGAHTLSFQGIFWVKSARQGTREENEARTRRFRDSTLSLRRAIALFDLIEAEDGAYAGMDKVVFSRAMARKKLMEIRPFRPSGYGHGERDELVRQLVADFERCAAEYPGSPLAAPARSAAGWWRRNVPQAWERR